MAARKSKGNKPTGRKVRSLRHWKQQFDPNAAFIARKRLHLFGTEYAAGEVLPQDVTDQMGRTKLKRFWQSNRIELAEFEPTQAIGVGTPVVDIKTPEEIAQAEQAALIEQITAEAVMEADGPEPTGEE